ncbi:TetR family transcriptional regulator [Haloactinopolyspora alba]|nr:TetR family transcriptional regulator [Haloactinopolyspora alba]
MVPDTGRTPHAGTDLRERRRLSTRREITRQAVDLVLEHGLAEVTVEDIAGAAGISPRTFFNYFPSKKAALVCGPEPLSDDIVEQFVADRETPLLDALQALFVENGALSPDIRDGVRSVQRLLARYPELMPALHESIAEFESTVAGAVARRLGVDEHDDRPVVAAAVSSALLRVAVTKHSGETESPLEQDIADSFTALRAVMA